MMNFETTSCHMAHRHTSCANCDKPIFKGRTVFKHQDLDNDFCSPECVQEFTEYE